MTEARLTLARLAGEYGLKTLDADLAAKKLGLNLRRGAALVKPWQEDKLRPELERMKAQKDRRNRHLLADRDEMDYSEYLADPDTARLGFANTEMARLLSPIRERMQNEADTA